MNNISQDVFYTEFVRVLAKKPEEIQAQLTPQKIDLMHATFGISGEAGEMLDAVKKSVVYDKPLDIDNLIEELGDIEFYLQQMRNRLGIPREEVIRRNVEKLKKRYPQGYTDAAAQARADKAQGHHQHLATFPNPEE